MLLSYWMEILILDVQYKTSFLLSLAASILATLGLSLLLLQEQQLSPKASDLATLYLLASVLCDSVYLTMPTESAGHTNTSRPLILRCCIHSVLLVLESRAKHLAFSILSMDQSPEELHGVLSRVLFTWINPILLQGYKNILIDQDLPSLSQDIKPEFTRKAILQAWFQRG
jgi:ATP-binding cassette subfamily C (CFTR/MRP) protein 1